MLVYFVDVVFRSLQSASVVRAQVVAVSHEGDVTAIRVKAHKVGACNRNTGRTG